MLSLDVESRIRILGDLGTKRLLALRQMLMLAAAAEEEEEEEEENSA